jgi:hydroxyacylglutathione hydrolase
MRLTKFIFSLLTLISTGNIYAQFSEKFPMAQAKKVEIQQFHDDGLAHFSYAVVANGKMIVIDPARNPLPYYEFAQEKKANIIAIFNTHPHADFVSSHLDIHQDKGAIIYTSSLVAANYPHAAFDEGAIFDFGNGVILRSLETPGHSPDGISIVLEEDGKQIAVFTGDTLFVGDVGRPDLRENAGNIKAQRVELAKMMYFSTREKLMQLEDDVLVYPAHGAGSLCGKAIGTDKVSTIGKEKASNYALQDMSEEDFVNLLLEDQPFIPKYFPYNVEVNKKGPSPLLESVKNVKILEKNHLISPSALPIIDGRSQNLYKNSHISGSINIVQGAKFESWLGALLSPGQSYYLVADSEINLKELINKTAKIGYEKYIVGAFVYDDLIGQSQLSFDQKAFDSNPNDFTIIDIRNPSEVAKRKVFENAINIPLYELAERAQEIPTDKPIVMHCGTGYRSAAGSSILQTKLPKVKVIDMGAAIKNY